MSGGSDIFICFIVISIVFQDLAVAASGHKEPECVVTASSCLCEGRFIDNGYL